MKLAKLVSFLLLVIFSRSASASDTSSSLVVDKDRRTGYFYGGVEVASLSSSIESLFGYGAQIGYQYILTGRWAANLSLSQIYGAGNGLTALYTGATVSARWAFAREFAQKRTDILFEGKRIFEEISSNEGVWSLGFEMNQLFLNGEVLVYNATGIGVVLAYDTRFWNRMFRPELRYAMMTANDEPMSGIFFNLVTPF